MKKMLTATDKLILALAFLGDVALETYTRGSGYRGKGSWLGAVLNASPDSIRGTFWRTLKVGDIEKTIDEKGSVFYKLTSQGQKRKERFYPLSALSKKGWDKKWRVVIFDIPEKMRSSRNHLRYTLINLGFGKVQESVYITPLDVLSDLREYLNTIKMSNYVFAFEATDFVNQNPKLVSGYIWGLEALEREYAKLDAEVSWCQRHICSKEEKDKIRELLFKLALKDPCLPPELLPDGWQADEIKKKAFALLMRPH